MFSHSALVYANTDNNLSKALTRLSSAREGNAALDNTLRENQRRFLQTRAATRFATALRNHYSAALDSATYDFDYELFKYAHEPHPKRNLRIRAMQEIVMYGLLGHHTFISKSNAKLKKYEWAKPGKYPRLIVDLTVVGSLLGGFSAKIVKQCMSTFTYSSKYRSQFIGSPQPNLLREVFTQLEYPEGASYFCYFSDDSCFSVKCKDGIYRCNMDISSCDTSHTERLFEYILCTLPQHTLLYSYTRRMFSQLTKPLKFSSVDGRERRTFKINFPTLLSGSTATTFVNNYANALISLRLSKVDFTKLTRDQCAAKIIECAKDVGYIVTCEDATDKCHLQFLKYSPDVDNSPYINIGVLLRAMGNCVGDLPGRTKTGFSKRADQFTREVLAGFRYSGRSPIHEALTEKYGLSGDDTARFTNQTVLENFHHKYVHRVSIEAITRRYNTTPNEIYETIDAIRTAPRRCVIRTAFTDAVYLKDYGYPPPTVHTLY